MRYLQRLTTRPSPDDLTAGEQRLVERRFRAAENTVLVDDQPVDWDTIQEVEVVKAPTVAGVMAPLVRWFVGSDRYHVGIYFAGHYEAVLPNLPRNVARHVVQEIAYHAPMPVRYTGIEGLSPVEERR